MANTYELISSNVLGSSAASVTFSAIPSTYTDLLLKCSARATASSVYPDSILANFNGDTSAIYSMTSVYGEKATASSYRRSSDTFLMILQSINGGTSTSNTFSNVELYIPNYAGNANKCMSASFATEANTDTNLYWTVGVEAGLYATTTAISSIALTLGSSFASGSSFYLYGIKST